MELNTTGIEPSNLITVRSYFGLTADGGGTVYALIAPPILVSVAWFNYTYTNDVPYIDEYYWYVSWAYGYLLFFWMFSHLYSKSAVMRFFYTQAAVL